RGAWSGSREAAPSRVGVAGAGRCVALDGRGQPIEGALVTFGPVHHTRREQNVADDDLTSLENEIEATRDRLAATIVELVARANRKTMVSRRVAGVKAHFVDPATGAPRTDTILKVAGGVAAVVVTIAVLRKIARR